MRPAVDTIHAPPFPRGLPWINTEQLRIDKQIGRPVVIAFWDQRRGASISPLLELEAWHQRYCARGARIIAVHVDGEGDGVPADVVEATARRLGLTMPIVIDEELRIADAFGLSGVPSRYIFDQGLKLVDAHYGLGGITDGEQLLAALVEHGEQQLAERRVQGETGATVAPALPATEAEEDPTCDQGAAVPPAKQPRLIVTAPTRDALPAPVADAGELVQPEPAELLDGDSRGSYAAGGVWLRLHGSGTAQLAGGPLLGVTAPGIYLARRHAAHTAGELVLTLTGDVVCDEIQLEPGAVAG